jgi:RHS repeat-associated protein
MSRSDPTAGDETDYRYNALNQRLSKTTGMFATIHIWDGGQIAFDVWSVYGNPYSKQYLQGHYQHGAVMFGSFTPNLVNSTGDAVAAVTAFNLTSNNMSIGHYEAYGTALATAYANNPYGYRGYYTDTETGFAYLNARYYDPATQRFTQEDTYWGDNMQRNLYAYCSGNPVMYTDPSGHYKQVQQGSRGEDVKTLQKLLNAHGANLAVDGDFGPLTKSAVVSYQRSTGTLLVDGIAGKNTWERLLSTQPSSGGSLTGGNPAQGTGNGGTASSDGGPLSGIIHGGEAIVDSIPYVDTAVMGAFFLMFDKIDDTYHANQNCWQSVFGYNALYDFLFGMGTSMENAIFQFTSDDQDYRIWAWKGDYVNLGAGAEMGIYYRQIISLPFGKKIPTQHWGVDKSLAMKMTMTLDFDGKQIIDYAPNAKQWWITGFNPAHKNVSAKNLSATFTVTFNTNQMYTDFKNSNPRGWTFDDNKHIAKFAFK